MTGAVASYTKPSSAVSAHTAPVATSQSTAGIAFERTILRFDDLPAEAQRLAPDLSVLAEVVTAIPGLSIRNGVTTQKRIGARSYATKIVIVTVTRKMKKRSDGRYSPSGPWALASSQTLNTVSGVRATRRTGTIVPGTLTDTYATLASGPAPSRERVDGQNAEMFLPAEVRSRLSYEFPQPEAHLGEITQWERSSRISQEVVIFRQQGPAAVVLTATRPDRAHAPWAVTQYSYVLETGVKALGR
jgi:hypothetical protein